MKKLFLLLFGFILVIMGIVLVLKEWPEVVTVFKGVIGGLVAIVGLIVLCLVNE
jgi:hypothetical protein